jgi:hypothetical protein
MSSHDHPARVWQALKSLNGRAKRVTKTRGARGQSMTEYALIAILVCLGIGVIITATGPAIGNVFSNTVYNLLGQKFTPMSTLSSNDIQTYSARISTITPPPPTYLTNTPLVPTCQAGAARAGTWARTSTPATWVPGTPGCS